MKIFDENQIFRQVATGWWLPESINIEIWNQMKYELIEPVMHGTVDEISHSSNQIKRVMHRSLSAMLSGSKIRRGGI